MKNNSGHSYQLVSFEQLANTNEELKSLIEQDLANSNKAIYTSNQTSGRGKANRKWESTEGSIALSFAVEAEQNKNQNLLVFIIATVSYTHLTLPTTSRV